MSIPQTQAIMPVLLHILADEKSHNTHALNEILTEKFQVTERNHKEFCNRVEQAIEGLKEGGLIDLDGNGMLKITYQGLRIVELSPDGNNAIFEVLSGPKEDEEDMEEEEELADEE